MNKLIKQTKQVIVSPVKAYRSLLLGQPVKLACTASSGFIVSHFLSQWAHFAPVWNKNPAAAFPILAAQFTLIFIGLFTLAGLIHLSADILGGGGRAVNLFYFIQISLFPLWLAGPMIWLLQWLNSNNFNVYVWAALLIWSFLLLIIGIREIYRFTIMQSLLAVLIPAGASAIVLLLTIYAGWNLIPDLMDHSTNPVQPS